MQVSDKSSAIHPFKWQEMGFQHRVTALTYDQREAEWKRRGQDNEVRYSSGSCMYAWTFYANYFGVYTFAVQHSEVDSSRIAPYGTNSISALGNSRAMIAFVALHLNIP